MEKERRKYFTKEAIRLGYHSEKEFCSRRSDKDTFYTANAIEALCVENKEASRELDSISMCHELATAISEKREWQKTHEGDMCAADAMKPFVQGRSGQGECSWAPIVR